MDGGAVDTQAVGMPCTPPTRTTPPAPASSFALALALPLLFAWHAASAQTTELLVMAEEPDKSYAIPIAEIIGFDFALSNFNRAFSGSSDYDVSGRSIRRNLTHRWVTDNDPFRVNQFAHPYQGALYHGAGRSTGLNYWEASALTFAGSAWWEITGEKTPPSYNDQVASGIAGSFLGEPLFRMAKLLLHGDNNVPLFWREWGAAAISPPVGLNHLMYGSRFDSAFNDHHPVYDTRLRLGYSHVTHDDVGNSTQLKRNEAVVDFAMDYGLPGKPGYTYQRPFDYFSFRVVATSAHGIDNIATRGMLFGTDYEIGNNYRGIWGLYGSYDYVSPQIFNISTTALSLGTTGQLWLAKDVALQGSALLGVGYSAASTLRRIVSNDRDYHYGLAPRASLNLRMLMGSRAMAEVSGQRYYLGSLANRSAGSDDITRVESAFTMRISGPHAIALKYVWSHRNASYQSGGDRTQTLGTVGIYYTLLGEDGFGKTEWRAASSD